MRAWILFLFVLSLSGCLDSNEDTAALDEAPTETNTSQGSSESPAEQPQNEAASAPVPPPSGREPVTPVTIQDSLGYLVCAPMVHQPGWCSGFGIDVGAYWEGSLKGNATTFTFTVEWTPATPASNQLEIGLVCVKGPNCPNDREILAAVQGASPLTLDVQGNWTKGEDVFVYVAPINPTEPVGHYTQVRDGTVVDGAGAFTN